MEFKRGDTVFVARYQPREVERPCPVCFGEKVVRVILGDDTVVETPCDFCGVGYEGSRGYITEYEREPRAERTTISGVRIEDGATRSVAYYSDNFVFAPEDVFADEPSALARANVLRAAADKYDAERSDMGKKRAGQKASWSIGYHMRTAKNDRKNAAYHEERARILKQGVK